MCFHGVQQWDVQGVGTVLSLVVVFWLLGMA